MPSMFGNMLGRTLERIGRRMAGLELTGEVTSADPYGGFWGEHYNPSVLVQQKGLTVFDRMRSDDQVKAALTFKKRAVLAKGWDVQPPDSHVSDEKHPPTEFVKWCLTRLPGTMSGRLFQIMSALDYGFSVSEKVYEQVNEGQWAGHLVLSQIKVRKPHDFTFWLDRGGDILDDGVSQAGIRFPREKFIIFTHGSNCSGNPYGHSDLEAAYRAWWSKENAYKWLNVLLQRFGVPPVFALYNPDAYQDGTRSDLKRIVRRLQSATSGLIPRRRAENLELWTPELAGQAHEVFIPAIDKFDTHIARALLMPGLLGLTPDEGVGSMARASVHFDVFLLEVEDLRREVLETVMQEQVIRQLVALNFPELSEDDYPHFHLNPLAEDDTAAILEAWNKLVGTNVVTATTADEDHVRGLLGFPGRDEGEAKQIEDPNASGKDDDDDDEDDDDEDDTELAAGQPRHPKGSSQGGQFASKGGVGSAIKAMDAGGSDRDQTKRFLEEMGYGGRPSVVDQAGLDAAIAEGAAEAHRALGDIPDGPSAATMAEQFRTGDLYVGEGFNVNGTFVAVGEGEVSADFASFWVENSGRTGVLQRMAIPKSAVRATEGDLYGMLDADRTAAIAEVNGRLTAAVTSGKIDVDQVGKLSKELSDTNRAYDWARQDLSRYAAMKGVDVVEMTPAGVTGGAKEWVIVNRSKVIVQDTNLALRTGTLGRMVSRGSDLEAEWETVTAALATDKTEHSLRSRLDALDASMTQALSEALMTSFTAVERAVERGNLEVDFGSGPALRRAVTMALLEALEAGRQDLASEVNMTKALASKPNYRPKDALKWLRKKALLVAGIIEQDVLEKTRMALMTAARTGQSVRDAMASIRKVYGPYLGKSVDPSVTSPARLETIVRTNMAEAYNQGRLVMARDKDLDGLMQGMRYSAIVDSRTTAQCEHLDGRVFAIDDPALDRLAPPNHYQCRSVLVPVTISQVLEPGEILTAEEVGRALDLTPSDFGGSATSAKED